MVVDDYLFIGGENSRFHIVKLDRGCRDDGLVTADPQVVFHAPGWDDELLAGGSVRKPARVVTSTSWPPCSQVHITWVDPPGCVEPRLGRRQLRLALRHLWDSTEAGRGRRRKHR